MNEYMMNGPSSGMIIAMVIFCLMFVALLTLSLAALVKYVFGNRQNKTQMTHEENSNA